MDLDVEVVIPHLLLDKTYAERPGVEGAKYVMSPPLRDKSNHRALWEALERGQIDTVATDHCPFDVEQKRLGDGDFTKIPNGIPAIEDRVNLLYTYGVSRGRLQPGALRGRRQHPRRAAVRPVSAQGHRLGGQ